MNFSKSKYCSFCQCPKILWLNKYKPEVFVEDSSAKERMKKGNEVGDLAMRLFGDYTEVTAYDKNGNLDISQMIKNTNDCIEKGVENICEASFFVDGHYCAVDILRKEGDGYAIYEVKSSTGVKPVYILDVTYQKKVLEKSGIKVTGTYIIHINNQYVFNKTLNIKELFTIRSIWDEVEEESKKHDIDADLKKANEICACETEPNIDISKNCQRPYSCGFWNYCSRHLPKLNVFDLIGMNINKKIDAYKRGFADYKDARKAVTLTEKQKRQIDYTLNDLGDYVDKKGIQSFLKTLSFPLYFLDFESMQFVIPEFDNTKPFQQMPFQYSLHYIESENGELKHKEFLGESGTDPRRPIAERLVADIPTNATVIVYNISFESERLKELADLFPDLSEHLLKVRENLVDLLKPFNKGYFYNRAMGGSISLKSVLPALFPNDPSLDYHNLEGVHNGGEAMDIFPKLKDMDKNEQEKARKELLEYCKLDTLATVKIWQKLVEVSK